MSTAQPDAQLPPAYDPQAHEQAIYRFWEEGGWFAPPEENPTGPGGEAREPFTIIMPPPNVTGALHLGHAITLTIEDALVRWHRMLGDPTLWLPGVDHAGIATQSVVEQQLAREGQTRHDLGRDAFVERVWQWVHRYRSRIEDQARRMGASCDWNRSVFTLDDTPRRAVRKTFVDLFNDGRIYRGARIINWDPQMMTALSDVEVEYQESEGHLWHVRYPFVDEQGNELADGVTIATTRPETIPADVAIAVHPDDERWQPHHGRLVRLPLRGFERRLPIVADAAVDPDFGTGALKITPGHDQLDFEIGERHGLEPIRAVDWDGSITAEGGIYVGMDRDDARARIVEHLDQDGYLVETERHLHNVGHSQRSGVAVEPLVSNQWFVDTTELAAEAARVVREGEVRIVPERSTSVYLQWMENIRPWCISRQLWWGHRIPAWYCRVCDAQAIIRADDGEITIGDDAQPIVAHEDPTACPQCGRAELIQDPDVLDTWFSSGLWTHSTLGWPDQSADLARFYPSSVMETGYDILFFWVARMIMLGCYNIGAAPFRTVYLHGLVRDAEGRKMSKSLDNVVDPLDKAEQYGMDALRFTLATGSTPGNDMRLTDERLEGARNFANKLWNGARFALGEIAQSNAAVGELPADLSTAPLEDRWILSRLEATVASVDELLTQFQLGEAGRQIQDFLWSEFFDWYVEASKVRLRAGDNSPLPVLAHVLDNGLRLLHPWMPFITETLWQRLPNRGRSDGEALIAARYPRPGDGARDAAAEFEFRMLQGVVGGIRQIRADHQVRPSHTAEVLILPKLGIPQSVWDAKSTIEHLTRSKVQVILANVELPDGRNVLLEEGTYASAVVEVGEVHLSLEGAVDVDQERRRLEKELADINRRLQGARSKLDNPNFRQNAPLAIVRREEIRLETLSGQHDLLVQRIERLS